MSWVEAIQAQLPEQAKDIKLNLDNVINKNSGISVDDALHISIACAVAAGNGKLASFIAQHSDNPVDVSAAYTAGYLMIQNNTWYPFVEMVGDNELKQLGAGLRMNAMANHGGTEKTKFEGYSLAASIIGKCPDCVKSHYESLKDLGYKTTQLKEIGRIAATIHAISKILVG